MQTVVTQLIVIKQCKEVTRRQLYINVLDVLAYSFLSKRMDRLEPHSIIFQSRNWGFKPVRKLVSLYSHLNTMLYFIGRHRKIGKTVTLQVTRKLNV